MEKLLKAALILSLLGIFLLLLLSSALKNTPSSINEAKELPEYEKVRVQGKILTLREASPNFFILKVADNTGNISVTLNSKKSLLKQKSFQEKSLVEIRGKISFYKNETQINADKIILLEDAA